VTWQKPTKQNDFKGFHPHPYILDASFFEMVAFCSSFSNPKLIPSYSIKYGSRLIRAKSDKIDEHYYLYYFICFYGYYTGIYIIE